MTADQATIPPGHSWNRLPIAGAAAAVVGAIACAVLGAANPKHFFYSWLVSFLFFCSLALGGLFFVLIQYASQGGWGIVLRRIGETIFVTLPVMAALFLPVDRKSTRLNSSHLVISYAVFCLKKKKLRSDLQEAFCENPAMAACRGAVLAAVGRLADGARLHGVPILRDDTEHSRESTTWTLQK